MAQTKRDRAGSDIPQTVTARTRDQPEAEHSERSTGGSRGAVQPPNSVRQPINKAQALDKVPATYFCGGLGVSGGEDA